MKILHTSDIHLGSPITAHLDGARAATRRRELQDGFARLTRRATELGCSAIIIAGDLFDTEGASRRLIEATLATVAAAESIKFYYLPGNHEGDAIARLGVKLPENLYIFGEEWTYFKLGGITLLGRSTVKADMFSEIKRPEGRSIAVLHGELRDGSGTDDYIGAADAERSEIDYIALGHYHSYSSRELSDGRCAVYSGTPEGRGFDEAGERGFVVIDVKETAVSHSFIPSDGRRLWIVEVDISGEESQSELEAAVGRAIAGVRGEDMLRVVLTGEHSASSSRDLESVKRRFASGYFYFEVKDKSRLKLDLSKFENDISLRGEFVRRVLADDTLSSEEKDDIIECGLRALEGEAIYGRGDL